MRTVVAIGGSMIAVGAGIAVAILLTRRHGASGDLGTEFDHFTSCKVEDKLVKYDKTTTECKEMCLADPMCSAFSYDLTDNSCILTHKDPVAEAEETAAGEWQLYARRPKGTQPSEWGPWDPQRCPPCGEEQGAGSVLTRVCSGPRCIGPAKHKCAVTACFDTFEGFSMDS